MNTRLLHSVLTHATALANGSAADDAALLRAFAQNHDPAAFAELVRRYGRLVWAVCRQLRPTDADAEDAFQATFLVLVRSAGSIRTNALGPWLHTVAHRVAGRAARGDGRRRKREHAAAAPDRDAAVPPTAWDALTAAVHDEVAKLPDHLRIPFVMCCLEGRGTTDAAKHLGWKLGTLSGRLTRAKQELLDRLAKRGLPASAVAVAAFAGGTVPAAVAAKALDLIHVETIPSTVLELAKGATIMSKTKLLAAAFLLAAGLTATVGGWLASANAQGKKPTDTAKQVEILRKQVDALDKEHADKVKAAPKWEYHYHAMFFDKNGKPAGMKAADFEKLLETMDADGWQYLGQSDVVGLQGTALPTHVFRRPKGNVVPVRFRVQLDTPWGKMPPEVADVRDTILQRMRKDPAETFAAALATRLRATPEATTAVDQHGRTMLEVDVLSVLLAEARQAAGGPKRAAAVAQLLDEAIKKEQAGDQLAAIDNAVKKQWAEAALKAADEALKAKDGDERTRAENLVKKFEAQKALKEIEAKAPRKPTEAAALAEDVRQARDRKTVRFAAADYGITGDDLMTVIMKAVERKFDRRTNPKPFDLTGRADSVEAVGSAANVEWLKALMEGAKAKPASR